MENGDARTRAKRWTLQSDIQASPSEIRTSLLMMDTESGEDTSMRRRENGGDEESDNEDNLLTEKSFNRTPLQDRTKYEKLKSNYVTSDDSDTEFAGSHAGESIKRISFKQIVTGNIQEKLVNVYQKVDKSHLGKVPIVRKLKGTKKGKGKDAGTRGDDVGRSVGDGEEDDKDSIGSASDLRADDMIDEFEVKTIPNVRNHIEDAISESIKTCGSSAYHAECESVTTHEDDVSRIVSARKKIIKKRREPQNELSPPDEEEDDNIHKYGDRPLLLDDELDYDSENVDEASPGAVEVAEEKQSFPARTMEQPQERHSFVQPPKMLDTLLPIADNEYVKFSSDDGQNLEECELESGISKSKSEKKSSKFPYLKDKTKSKSTEKIKKTKESSGKATKKGSMAEDSLGTSAFNYQSLKRGVKSGFSNMSFEDFPSDQEGAEGTTNVATTKITPFEVVRNEKMILEAEKKFGSLKRRPHPFS
uniref:Uncharacterized protein n=1 Tax=Phlebotomus papatasi TaxID=29031 RepID=A0A1B0DDM2_PHLPP